MACGDRNHSSYLYRIGDVSLLIDCGEPISRSFKASGASYDSIDRIFLSHLHFDHSGGFFMLMQGFWLEQRRKDLFVNLPADGIKPFRQMLDAACLFEELLPFRLIFEPIEAGKAVLHDQVRVTPFRTSHLDGFRKSFQAKYPGDYLACSFLLESPEARIGHSADLGKPEDLEPLVRQPLDLLVCELAHFPPERLFEFLQGRQIKHLAFVHLGREFWVHLEKTRTLAARLLPGMSLSFPKDQEMIQL